MLIFTNSFVLQRIDNAIAGEGDPWTTNGSLECQCIEGSLQSLVVTDYRGGAADLEFIKVVLLKGRELTDVAVCPHATMPLPRRREHYRLLETSRRTSESCLGYLYNVFPVLMHEDKMGMILDYIETLMFLLIR